MALKLQVRVIQARNLAAKDYNGFSDPYVRVILGKQKAKSHTVYKSLDPVWNEEFVLQVADPESEIVHVTLWDEDFLNVDDFLGKVDIPLSMVLKSEGNIMVPAWFTLQKLVPDSKYFISGEVMIGLSLWGSHDLLSSDSTSSAILSTSATNFSDNESFTLSTAQSESSIEERDPPRSKEAQTKRHGTLKKRILPSSISILPSKFHFPSMSSNFSPSKKKTSSAPWAEKESSLKLPEDVEYMDPGPEGSEIVHSSQIDAKEVPVSWFDEDLKAIPSEGEFPAPFTGGTVVDKEYGITARAMNALIFKPDSQFWIEFTTARKATDLDAGPWVESPGAEEGSKKRSVSYMTAPSTLVKSVRASEVYEYRRADSGGYVVELNVATPDVPYGNTFQTQMQFCITHKTDDSCHLRVSWQAHFLQSTMMRGMIENGMGSGIKDTYNTFSQILNKYAPPAAAPAQGAAEESEKPRQPTWRYALEYLGDWQLMMTLLALIVLPIHFQKCRGGHHAQQGLEFGPVELPDSYMELFWAAIVVLSAERTFIRTFTFLTSVIFQASDHGKKAKGEGWRVTIKLIEAENLPGLDFTGRSDPYATFTCNGKTRRSSVKLQTLTPKWNEILEFDAFDDVPSTMDVELLDYDGPFSMAELLGRAEINFVKTAASELADVWIPLQGGRAVTQNARLHLRVFLTNTSDHKQMRMLQNLEKEVGTKIVRKSPEQNETFQKLFSLPDNEILIHDFSCAIKKKIPLQGRLFLSPRLLGFYSNLFGLKTKFFIQWEDIDQIKDSTSTLNRLMNPSITLYLKEGRGLDAGLGSYGVDSSGRLKFRLMSFVRPSTAIRSIQILWKSRSLPPEVKVKQIEEANMLDFKSSLSEGGQPSDGALLSGKEQPVHMMEVGKFEISISAEQFLSVVEQPNMIERVALLNGMANFTATAWEEVTTDSGKKKLRRSVKYSLTRQACCFASRVTAIQQKWKAADNSHASIEESIILHDVPFGDCFHVETRKEIQTRRGAQMKTEIRAWVGVAWEKECDVKDKITNNVVINFKKSINRFGEVLVTEVIAATQGTGQLYGGA